MYVPISLHIKKVILMTEGDISSQPIKNSILVMTYSLKPKSTYLSYTCLCNVLVQWNVLYFSSGLTQCLTKGRQGVTSLEKDFSGFIWQYQSLWTFTCFRPFKSKKASFNTTVTWYYNNYMQSFSFN